MGTAATPPTVLLVEDEQLISQLVADWLSERGFAVREAATGDEALAYLGAGGAADVLFTDVILPGGMDGSELAQRARQMRPDLPIVYASGRYGYSDLRPMVPRSMFVPKPYDPANVCTLLERLTAATHWRTGLAEQLSGSPSMARDVTGDATERVRDPNAHFRPVLQFWPRARRTS